MDKLDGHLVEEMITNDSTQVETKNNDVQDIDPANWLSHSDTKVIGDVVVNVGGKARKLKIAAITEKENLGIMKASRVMDPNNPKQMKMDWNQYRLQAIAYSINKANPDTTIFADQLKDKLVGELTTIQAAIFKLSRLESDERTNVTDFFA